MKEGRERDSADSSSTAERPIWHYFSGFGSPPTGLAQAKLSNVHPLKLHPSPIPLLSRSFLVFFPEVVEVLQH